MALRPPGVALAGGALIISPRRGSPGLGPLLCLWPGVFFGVSSPRRLAAPAARAIFSATVGAIFGFDTAPRRGGSLVYPQSAPHVGTPL